MRKLVLFAATGAGSGYSPVAPGTAGSVVGLALHAGLLAVLGSAAVGYLGAAIGISLLGIWAAGRAEAIFERRDDGRITIDEVAGMLVSLALLPVSWKVAVSGFFVFRLFDIWKPYPARAVESLPGGLGVMADDLVAGVYANLTGQVVWRLLLEP